MPNAACAMVAEEMGEMCKRLIDEYDREQSNRQTSCGFMMENLPTLRLVRSFPNHINWPNSAKRTLAVSSQQQCRFKVKNRQNMFSLFM